MKLENLEQVLNIFENNALEQEKCTFQEGNAKKYNKYSKNIEVCARWLYSNNLLIKLSQFYTHSSNNVKGWAARLLLEIDTENAERVLNELVLSNNFDSKYVLMEWKNGTLDMDFFKQ